MSVDRGGLGTPSLDLLPRVSHKATVKVGLAMSVGSSETQMQKEVLFTEDRLILFTVCVIGTKRVEVI